MFMILVLIMMKLLLLLYHIFINIRGLKMAWFKMFGFVKWVFISAIMFFGCSLPSINSLKCISVNNQECKVRPQIVNFNVDEPEFFPFSIKTSK